jgi:hypothetical protein
MLEGPLRNGRVGQLAAALGCPADVDAITLNLLDRTALGTDAYESVRLSVDHLVNRRVAWWSMVHGVVPPSLRAQALSVMWRTSETAPADGGIALVLAAVREALSIPD